MVMKDDTPLKPLAHDQSLISGIIGMSDTNVMWMFLLCMFHITTYCRFVTCQFNKHALQSAGCSAYVTFRNVVY